MSRTTRISLLIIACIIVLSGLASVFVVLPMLENKREAERAELFESAVTLMENGEYGAAREVFISLGYYRGADALALECTNLIDYEAIKVLMNEGRFEEARSAFLELGSVKDSFELARVCENHIKYNNALLLFEAGEYIQAAQIFSSLGDFEDAPEMFALCDYTIMYLKAESQIENNEYEAALEMLAELPADFKETQSLIQHCENSIAYLKAVNVYDEGMYYTAYTMFLWLEDFRDAAVRAQECIQELPETGIINTLEGFSGTGVSLEIKSPKDDTRPTLLHLYSEEDELLIEMFIRADESLKLTLPAGTYMLKMAFGEQWFGFEELFGDSGIYQTMLFSDSEYNRFNRGTYTLSLRTASDGNVGAENITRAGF